ncbi:MAG: DUF4224 domain-containing protein [Nitrosomonadales bacterium]|nr:DUF4224 domain-containing protein [Nitrosomonadales bacterium]
MGIPFRTNGHGRPVVTRSSVEGKTEQLTAPQRLIWQSAMTMRLQLKRGQSYTWKSLHQTQFLHSEWPQNGTRKMCYLVKLLELRLII